MPPTHGSIAIILLSLFLVCASCVTPFGKRETVLVGRDAVISKIDSAIYPDPASQQLPEQKAFPPLTADQCAQILALFAFKDGDETIGVFRHAELKPLGAQMAAAIKRLNPRDRLVIISRHDKKNVIFNRPDRNTMMIWNDASGLNVVFGTIREDVLDGSDHDREAWKEIGAISLTRSTSESDLLPSPFYVLQKLADGKTHPTWAIVPTEKLASLPSISDEKLPERQEEKPQPVELTNKLAELKKAFDQGLITKDEYDAKRKEILSKY